MKHLIPILLLYTFTFNLHLLSAAVPLRWTVELTAQPQQVFTLQRPRGETYELEAVLKNRGKPFETAITNACIYWQTNGMENLYWSASASVSNNVLRATWLPSMDPGATTVRGYIGDPGHIYAAAFQFRFIASPGALPNELPLPQKVIDFAQVTVLNPPWSGGGADGVDTNAVIDIANATIATNATITTLTSSISSLESTKRDKTDNSIHGGPGYGCWTISTMPCDWSASAGRWQYEQNGTVYGYVTSDRRHIKYSDATYDLTDPLPYEGKTEVGGLPIWYAPPTGESYLCSGLDAHNVPLDPNVALLFSAAISTNNPALVSAVQSISPPSPPSLRLYDAVRDCYWIGHMVNGVISWEVEE